MELSKYLSAFSSLNLFEEVKQIIEDGLEELDDEEDDDLQMKPMWVKFNLDLIIENYCSGQTYTLSPQRASNL